MACGKEFIMLNLVGWLDQVVLSKTKAGPDILVFDQGNNKIESNCGRMNWQK